MSKLILILGIILIIVSVPILIIGTQGTANETVEQVIHSLACNPNETLVENRSSYIPGRGSGGDVVEFFCEIEPGQGRDVTLQAVMVIAGGFVIPFGLGMIFTLGASFALARGATKRFTGNMLSYAQSFPTGQPTHSTVINLRGGSANIPPETQEILNNFFGDTSQWTTGGGADDSLSGKLAQLEEAYEKNLITEEEYRKTRQAILDSMDD